MTAADESLLETYVHRPRALSATERRRAEALLQNDAEAVAWAGVLRAMYDAFDALAGTGVPESVEAFVDDLFVPPTVVPLSPPPEPAGPTVLAADDGTAGRFQPMSVLASETDGVLVRILRDTERDEGRIYLLARDPETYRFAMFESGDEQLQVALQHNGQGRFADADRVSPDSLRRGRIRRCLWHGPVPSRDEPLPPISFDGYVVRPTWTRGRTLRLQSATRNADRPPLRWAGWAGPDDVTLVRFDDHGAELPVFPTADGTLRLFG